jgi:AraC-like DNA-binding protein
VTAGDGGVQYSSEDIVLTKHDVVVVNSGELHRVYSDGGISFDYVIIDESFCRENGINTSERYFDRVFKCEKTEEIFDRAYERYREYKSDPATMKTAKLRLAVLELLICLYDGHSVAKSQRPSVVGAPQDYIKKVLEYIAEHYTEQLTLEGVAQVCGITKYHLAREFKKYTGQTVVTYINILRCKKAEACLTEGMTVTEAAMECGFDSISYFSRTYKKLMGVPPSSKKSK